MSQECPVNCKDHPDAVEKINWVCVECKRNLKADFDRIMTERELASTKRDADALAAAPKELSEAEVKKRRDMYK